MTMTGVELIAAERKRQVEEKGHTIESDIAKYAQGTIAGIGGCIAMDVFSAFPQPKGEQEDNAQALIAYSQSLQGRPHLERLAIAGALIAAEIDRWEHAAGNQQ